MAIFNSYVKLPEGSPETRRQFASGFMVEKDPQAACVFCASLKLGIKSDQELVGPQMANVLQGT